MSFLETAILGIGTGIAKGVLQLWLGSDAPIQSSAAGSILDILKSKTTDVLAQRSADRQFQVIAERAAKNLVELVEAEGDQIPDERARYLIDLAGRAVTATVASPDRLIKVDLSPEPLTGVFFAAASTEKEVADLEEHEQELYRSMLYEAAQDIVDVASQLPRFTEASLAEVLRRGSEIQDLARQILDEARTIRKRTDQDAIEEKRFEADYRREIARRLDVLQLFGVEVATTSKRYSLSVAYVSLSLATASATGDTNRESVSVEDALRRSTRLLISGAAGSGKTTILQWIAVMGASWRHEAELAELNDCLPFFIRLRQFNEDDLPPPESFVDQDAANLAGRMPHGWVHKQLETGRAIVLIDGLDEVQQSRRDRVRTWVSDLLATFPKTRYVLTARPHAVAPDWFDSFEAAELQEMRSDVVEGFIDHWHNAVASVETTQDRRESLKVLGNTLKEMLRTTPELRRFATSPLLCALLCALHRDRLRNIPHHRAKLYSDFVDLFLRRDLERDIPQGPEYPQMEEPHKRAFLCDLALWMTRSGTVQLTRDEVDERFSKSIRSIQNLPSETTGTGVRRLFVERSGILRQSGPGLIDFPHRIFQEFLTAEGILADLGVKELIQNAHDDQWQETIVLAAGLARPNEAEELVSSILERGARERDHRHRLYLLAVRAQQSATRLPVGSSVKEQVRIRLDHVVPPETMLEAQQLSAAGDMAVPFLPYDADRPLRTTTPSVRCLALIGTEQSLSQLAEYTKDRRKGVAEEIYRSRLYTADLDRYYALVLARLELLYLRYTKITDIAFVARLPRLDTIDLSYTEVRDLAPLSLCPRLESVDLRGLDIDDLSPLTHCSALKTVTISADQQVDPLALGVLVERGVSLRNV